MDHEDRDNEHGTLKHPLVTFRHYGSNSHCRAHNDSDYRLQRSGHSPDPIADSDQRAEKVDSAPMDLGIGGAHRPNTKAAAREQELSWLKLSRKY